MKRRASRKSPFVVTIGAFASVSALACGGNTNDDQSAGGGTAGTGATGGTTGGTGGAGGAGGTSGSGGGVGGTSGSGGSGGVIIEGGIPCPAAVPDSYTQCTEKGQSCTYDVQCQSGLITHTFSCSSLGYWVLGVHPPCDKPFDSCPGTMLYCSTNGWNMPEGTNPPSPCPAAAPVEGAECYSGGFGGVYPDCGYACGPSGSGWQVAHCPYDETQSHWTLGPCE